MARGKSTGTVHQSEKQKPSAAATALDNIPTDKLQRRREFVDYPRELKAAAQKAAQEVGAQNKRLTDVFGVEKKVLSWVKDVNSMTPDVRARALRQFAFFVKDLDLTEQLDLFNNVGEPGGLEKDDGKSVFDASGNKAAPKASETEPVKKLTGAEPPKHVPSPAVPLDEALTKFTDAKAEAEAKRGGKELGAKDTTAAVEKIKTETLKPPGQAEKGAQEAKATPKPPSSTPKPPASRSASAAAKPTATRTNRKPTPEEAKVIKKTADKYITTDGKIPPGDEDEAPGNFIVH